MWRKPFYYRQAYCRAEVGFLETGAGGYPIRPLSRKPDILQQSCKAVRCLSDSRECQT